jgi:hypothetical protein
MLKGDYTTSCGAEGAETSRGLRGRRSIESFVTLQAVAFASRSTARERMIRMEQPSFCFHGHDIYPKFYDMWHNVEGQKGTTVSQLVGHIAAANVMALQTEHVPLWNIVINVHGFAGGLWIGGLNGSPTMKDDLRPFGVLRGMNVGPIWLVSCSAAKDTTGKEFCSVLAKTAGTMVIASDQSNQVTVWQGAKLLMAWRWNIDDFEGNVFGFYPTGGSTSGSDPSEFVWTVRN